MVDKKVNHDPEREMGSPPPQIMPALFGWMTIDYQSERAKELVEISKSLSPAKGKDTDS